MTTLDIAAPTAVPRAAVYDRVSKDKRGDARSVGQQEAENRAVCAAAGWAVEAVYTDNDRSASRFATKDRPDWQRLSAELEAGSYEVLVLWEPSRGSRDLVVWATLLAVCRARGVLIHITSHNRTYDPREAREWRTLAEDGVDSGYESEKTSARITRSVAMNAAKGRPHGKLLYGYRRTYDPASGAMVAQVPDEATAPVVREAARRVLAGETPNAVARDYNRRGVAAPRGSERGWDLTQVRRLLVNPGYAGKRVHRGEVVADAGWPALIDPADHAALVAKLTDPRRRTQHDSAVRHLLSGILRCGVCGSTVRVQKQRGAYQAYMCVNGFHTARKMAWVDEYVEAVIIERLSRPDVAELLASGDSDDADVLTARREVAELRARLDGFYDAAAAGDVTPAALARIEATLTPRIAAAEQRSYPRRVSPVVAQLAGDHAAEVWAELPITAKREVITTLMDVRLLKGRTGVRTFDPSLVEITWRG